jgi:hypothetical protein
MFGVVIMKFWDMVTLDAQDLCRSLRVSQSQSIFLGLLSFRAPVFLGCKILFVEGTVGLRCFTTIFFSLASLCRQIHSLQALCD